jgi:Nif-specific regulatory protein
MKANKKNFDGFTDSAIEGMLTYSWPGNIRELENYIERACVIATTKMIKLDDLFIQTGGKETGTVNRNLKIALNAFKTNFILKVLNEYDWNQTEAAEALDIQGTYLSRLIKELNLKEE